MQGLRVWCVVVATALSFFGCGGDDGSDDAGTSGLDAFLPEIPEPTGDAQSTWAGIIGDGDDAELIAGPATSGRPGDVFLRNSRGRFVVQSASRVIGVVPQGGNLVDAVPLGADGGDMAPDHFGELSMMYLLGRTCEHRSIEVLRDGSEGGVAAVRARGVAAANDFINLRGVGLLPIPNKLIPDLPDDVECATTYILEPDSPVLHLRFTLYNGGEREIEGPFGMINDTGGDVGVFQPGIGFGRIGSITDAVTANEAGPVPYGVYQGPGVAYGIIPRHEDPTTPNAHVSVLGVSLFAFGATALLEILNTQQNSFLDVAPEDGITVDVDVAVGLDAADIEATYRELIASETAPVTGTVLWDDGGEAHGARVAFFSDADGDGLLADDDSVVTFADTEPSGAFEADLPPGDYLVRADVEEKARSAVAAVTVGADGIDDLGLELPKPVRYDYRIVDREGGEGFLPARLTVIGDSPVRTDARTYPQYDRPSYVVRVITATHGTSVDLGDGADPALELAPGADYRLFATRGTEWSDDSIKLSPVAGEVPAELELSLQRVVDTSGYISSEYHVHSIGSPDSPITHIDRVASAVADGVELFAATDHDYVSDLQPVVEMLGLERLLRVIPGVEMSPMVYGHFNAFPIEHDPVSPNGGAIDWPAGAGGFAMVPGEIFEAARERGAELVQVNHPRTGPLGGTDITEHFDRMGLTFDYDNRTISGDPERMPVSPDFLRLPPDVQLFDLGFNALEVWNNFGVGDTNGDGTLELTKLDVVMRDWFNFLSFGKMLTPLGNSDTHNVWKDPLGIPRNYVRVLDDSADALASGLVVDDVLDTLAGRDETPIDVVVSNGPHIRVTVDGDAQPLGKVHTAAGGEIEIQVDAVAPHWAYFDTVTVYANATPEIDPEVNLDVTALQPVACFSARETIDPADPCALAPIQGTLALVEQDLAEGLARWEASQTITIGLADIPVRAGATGSDAWFVVRVDGQRPIYPVLLSGVITADNLSTLIDVPSINDREAALDGRGVPPAAFTSPFFVDFDGGGYVAPFAPQ